MSMRTGIETIYNITLIFEESVPEDKKLLLHKIIHEEYRVKNIFNDFLLTSDEFTIHYKGPSVGAVNIFNELIQRFRSNGVAIKTK